MRRGTRLARLVGALAVLVASVGVAPPARATFPGANGKIAFIRFILGRADIFVMDADGSNQTQLTHEPSDEMEPAWSPDGTKIAFNGNRDGDFEIFVMNADGSGLTQLTSNTAMDFHPEWTFDGRIVFSSDRPDAETPAGDPLYRPDPEIYLMNADGTGVRQLTHNRASDILPAPAPSEDKVAWTSDADGDQELYVMRLDGSEVRQVTDHPAVDALPSWSPQGNQLAFISERDYYPLTLPEQAPPDDGELYVVDTNGRNLRRLTTTPKRWEIVPAWSPDGTKIAFSGCVGVFFPLTCDLYTRNADGTGEVLVAADAAQPDWQRVRPGRVP